MTDIGDDLEVSHDWLSEQDIAQARARVPIVYVQAVPVRLDDLGQLTHVGLLLTIMPDRTMSRAVVGGRVNFGERLRDALARHLQNDLGPLALPRLPPSITPFTVAEYFPNPEISGFHDPRQHAVSLVYVIPIDGDPEPSRAALDFAWMRPEEVVDPAVIDEMNLGQDRLVRRALAHMGCLP